MADPNRKLPASSSIKAPKGITQSIAKFVETRAVEQATVGSVTGSMIARWVAYATDGAGSLVFNLINRVADLRAQGVAESAIRTTIGGEFATGDGMAEVARRLREGAEAIQKQAYSRAQTRVLEEAGDDDTTEFFWNAIGANSCIGCVARHGTIHTLAEWKAIGVPQSGTTPCRNRCKCRLIRVDRAMRLYKADSPQALTRDARRDVNKQMAYIKALEAQRGDEYARSTFEAKLGEWRRRKFDKSATAEAFNTKRA